MCLMPVGRLHAAGSVPKCSIDSVDVESDPGLLQAICAGRFTTRCRKQGNRLLCSSEESRDFVNVECLGDVHGCVKEHICRMRCRE